MEERKLKISQEEIAKFMEGRDPQERIVNLSYSYKNDFISVFYRDEQDRKCVKDEPFFPFLWATYEACNKLCGGNRDEVKKLLNKFQIGVKRLNNTNSLGEVRHEFDNGYLFLFYAKNKMSYSDFLRFFKWAGNPVYSDKKDDDKSLVNRDKNRQYLTVTPQEQFLISTGKRFFKGYTDYDQLLRMAFDLETEGLDPKRHRLKLNGVRLNRPVTIGGKTYKNWGKIFKISGKTEEEKNKSELEVIDLFLKLIYTFKPDIITAHNGENFDWNFIIVRCEMLGTSIEEMSKKYFHGESIHKETRESTLKLGGEVEKFYRTIVPDTTVTDSMHAVRRAQATNSSIKRADLKYISGFLGIKKDNRVYTPGQDIDKILMDTVNKYAFNDTDGDWYLYDETLPDSKETEFKKGKVGDKPFVMYKRNYLADGYEVVTGEYIINRYLLDDIWECDRVEYSYNGTDFMLAKIIPEPFSKCTTMGTAGQWKAIMLAWSYENELAIPLAANTGAFTGGLSRLLRVGYVRDVVKLDYNSLYPSIILTWGISDDTDLMQAMLHMLEYVLTNREKYKKLKKAAENIVDEYEKQLTHGIQLLKEQLAEYEVAKNDYKVNDNNQAVVKKLGNSFFGSYGSNNGAVFPWKSKKCAEQTTCTGRQCLRLMISHFHDLGYEPIVGDTDGFNFQIPKTYRYTEENPYIGKGLNREVKEGKAYTGFAADVAEFNDMYMKDFHYSPSAVNKMGLGIDEVVSSTINFSRKNYADYFPDKKYPEDVKLVGNTIKSKKMPQYIEIFLDTAIRQLLRGEGAKFIEFYYEYLAKIYNYQIPIRDIATKGKIKKSIKEYLEDMKQLTKAGRPKNRQAWYELAIANDLHVDNGDTIYYVNTGKSKSHSDIKKVTHYYYKDFDGNEIEFSNKIDSGYKKYKKECGMKIGTPILDKQKWIAMEYPGYYTTEEVIMNCILVPREIVDSESDVLCDDDNGIEYNVAKYIDMFNKRIKPLLVCFDKSIRDRIVVTNPENRQYFTEEECQMSSGQPYKTSDQDTYEQLMTMEDKEIKFWMEYGLVPPFIEECGMGTWECIQQDYIHRKAEEKRLGVDATREKFEKELNKLSIGEIDDLLEEGEIPDSLTKIADINPVNGDFVCKEYPDVVLATLANLVDLLEEKEKQLNEAAEVETESEKEIASVA